MLKGRRRTVGGGLFGPLLEVEQHLAFHHQVGGFQQGPHH
jgi:hypothetical protein